MKPHPKIRKTVKWGGAAIAAIALILGVVSLRWIALGSIAPRLIVGWEQGCVGFGWFTEEMSPPSWSGATVPFANMTIKSRWRWLHDARGYYIGFPLWLPALVGGGLSALAWRFDTLARRRERAGKCPKCSYDRTGLAPGAVCPECGTAGLPACVAVAPAAAGPTALPGQLPAFVRPPAGFLVAAGLWGFAAGLGIAIGVGAVSLVPMNQVGRWILVILPLLMILPIAVIGSALISPAWHSRSVAAAAAAFGVGFWLSIAVTFVFQTPGTAQGGVWFIAKVLFGVWRYVGVYTLVTWVIWRIIYGVRRSAYVRALKAAPGRCYACGFDLTALDVRAVCPECGRDRREHPGPARWAVPSDRVRRRMLVVAAALLVGGPTVYTVRWWLEARPQMRLLSSLGSTEFADLPTTNFGDNPQRLGGRGVILRLNDGSPRALYVVLPRGKAPGLPTVRIWLTDMLPMGDSGPHVYARRLKPAVVCDLNAGEAAILFKAGVPPALVEAMKAAGATSQPEPMWITPDDLVSPSAGTVWVAPSAYLGK